MFTAKSSGVYSFLVALRSRATQAHLGIYPKKPAATAVKICAAAAGVGYTPDTCSALQHLDVGDQIYVEGESNGDTSGTVTKLQIFFLY